MGGAPEWRKKGQSGQAYGGRCEGGQRIVPRRVAADIGVEPKALLMTTAATRGIAANRIANSDVAARRAVAELGPLGRGSPTRWPIAVATTISARRGAARSLRLPAPLPRVGPLLRRPA